MKVIKMDNKIYLSNVEVIDLAKQLYDKIAETYGITILSLRNVNIYPIPRGGIPAAFALIANNNIFKIVSDPLDADIFVDDIIDSGETMQRYCDNYPARPFYALIDKTDLNCKYNDDWVVFPWEVSEKGSVETIEANVTRIIEFVGEDPNRGGIVDTPKRFVKALSEWFSGYNYSDSDIEKLMKCFEDGAEGSDEMVIRKNIPLYSHCEHHLAPVFGTCTIAYIPNGKVVGLSKMDRLVEVYARRMQVQERLTNQIADAMQKYLNPIGVGVFINARHTCVESRGVHNQDSQTQTIALRGAMRNQPASRAEFLNACRQ